MKLFAFLLLSVVYALLLYFFKDNRPLVLFIAVAYPVLLTIVLRLMRKK